MNAQVTTRVTINASTKEVFEYLTDLKKHYLWNPHTQSIQPMTRLQQDSEYETVSLVFGQRVVALNKVTKFAANKELQLENNTGLVHYLADYKLTEMSGKTAVKLNLTLSADGKAFAFAKPVLKTMAQRELRSDLQSLKLAVEEKLA